VGSKFDYPRYKTLYYIWHVFGPELSNGEYRKIKCEFTPLDEDEEGVIECITTHKYMYTSRGAECEHLGNPQPGYPLEGVFYKDNMPWVFFKSLYNGQLDVFGSARVLMKRSEDPNIFDGAVFPPV
jgi:hypothetical protein